MKNKMKPNYKSKLGYGNLRYCSLRRRSDRFGYRQKKEQANNEAACSCDIVTEPFFPLANNGGGYNIKCFNYQKKSSSNIHTWPHIFST